MKIWHTFGIVALVASGSLVGGYCLGFRDGIERGGSLLTVTRGAVAVGQLRLLDESRMDDIRSSLESDIDNGLLWWHDLLKWPLLPALSALTDSDVASYEIYVQRMAVHRKAYPSPIQKVISSSDSEQARAYRELSEEVGSIVRRYAP